MNMTISIDNQNEDFLKLLRLTYLAQNSALEKSSLSLNLFNSKPRDKNEVFVKEETLRKYGFGDSDFWEIICPSLKKSDWLASFEDPNFNSEMDAFYAEFPGYKTLTKKISELNEELPPSYFLAKHLREERGESVLRENRDYRITLIEKEISKTSERLKEIKDFAYTKYRHKFIVTKKLIDSITNSLTEKETSRSNEIPSTFVENGMGYLQFGKLGEKIKVGGQNTRHFRLLQFLLSPMGTEKTVESVYAAISREKDEQDSVLNGFDEHRKKARRVAIIKNAIKELQKGNKLRNKLSFKFGIGAKGLRIEHK